MMHYVPSDEYSGLDRVRRYSGFVVNCDIFRWGGEGGEHGVGVAGFVFDNVARRNRF